MISRLAHNLSIVVVATLSFACGCAYAEVDPFQNVDAQWMSLDHYSDADKRGMIAPAPSKTDDADAHQPSSVAEGQIAPAFSGSSAASTPKVSSIAAPTRPVDLPAMPGMNKGFNVQVTTTEDDRILPMPAAVVNASTDLHLKDTNWQSPSSSPHQLKGKDDGVSDDEPHPLDVRLSFLPDGKVIPNPSDEHETAEHKARVAVETGALRPQQTSSSDPKTKAPPAVCAAIDAYKKQQLTAIQSDRVTLKALQEAIDSLGLQKQLGFMTSNVSALNSSPNSASPSIDIPASTSLR